MTHGQQVSIGNKQSQTSHILVYVTSSKPLIHIINNNEMTTFLLNKPVSETGYKLSVIPWRYEIFQPILPTKRKENSKYKRAKFKIFNLMESMKCLNK